MIRSSLAIAVLACLIACGEGGRESTASTGTAVSREVTAPILDIRGTATDGSLNFAYAQAATRLSDGAIVIADNLALAVRFIDGSGRLRRTVGREGGGPGEFRGVSWLGQCRPDSVFVWDSRQVRMSVFDSSGDFVRQYRVPADPSVTSNISSVRCSRTGEFALLGMPPRLRVPTPSDPGPHYRAPLWLADALGHVSHVFEEIPWQEGRPLGKVTSIALSPGRVYIGTADSAFVDLYGIDGDFIKAVPIGVELREPTDRHYDHSIAAQVAGSGTPEFRRDWQERLKAIPMPKYMPPYTGLFTDERRNLWVVTSVPGDSTTQLRVFGPDGVAMGDTRLPADTRVLEVGNGYIIGAYEDSGGEPHVAVYEIGELQANR